MSIHLVGGGWDDSAVDAVWAPFVAEAADAAARAGADGVAARIAVLLVGADDAGAAAYRGVLERAGAVDPVVVTVPEDGEFAASGLAGAHGVVVGGGLTPAYLRAVQPIAGELRRLVAAGLPYLGFSAGAAIAAEQAIVGGWRIGGVPIGAADIGEELDEVTVEAGIGLVDLSVDAHAAQWGTLARLIAATEAGLVGGGVAIDEDTAFVVSEAGLSVRGAGSVWAAQPGDGGVVVRTLA